MIYKGVHHVNHASFTATLLTLPVDVYETSLTMKISLTNKGSAEMCQMSFVWEYHERSSVVICLWLWLVRYHKRETQTKQPVIGQTRYIRRHSDQSNCTELSCDSPCDVFAVVRQLLHVSHSQTFFENCSHYKDDVLSLWQLVRSLRRIANPPRALLWRVRGEARQDYSCLDTSSTEKKMAYSRYEHTTFDSRILYNKNAIST